MRIIAGKHRGGKLLGPEGDVTRPITDRVKQSLFDILTPLLPESRVYDCFAGTGSMGLECLSRGAASITFFEADRAALTRLKKNIEAIDEDRICQVVPGDLFRLFKSTLPGKSQGADLIFLDPPYRFLRERPDDLRALATQFAVGHLRENGMVVLRHDADDALELPALERFDTREYGSMSLEFLRAKSQAAPERSE